MSQKSQSASPGPKPAVAQAEMAARDFAPAALPPASSALGPGLVVITGMAGAGKTQALHTFEDIGYFCIDNLPPALLTALVNLSGLSARPARRLAVVCDLRSQEFFFDLEKELRNLRESAVNFLLVFLDASDATLVTRYKETRRRHPLCEGDMTLLQGIIREREILSSIRETANYVIDSTELDSRELSQRIRALVADQDDLDGLRVAVFSFGFKHGPPTDADILIDVRFLPNPFYDPSLRQLTGLEQPVRDFVLGSAATGRFLDSWLQLLKTIMPGYVQEGKRYLSLGLGCTGGQHRSVVLAEETARFLRAQGYHTAVSHRDLALANRRSAAKRRPAESDSPLPLPPDSEPKTDRRLGANAGEKDGISGAAATGEPVSSAATGGLDPGNAGEKNHSAAFASGNLETAADQGGDS